MKKFTMVMFFALALTGAVFAQSAPDGQKVPDTGALPEVGLLNANSYANYFGTARMRDGRRIISDKYLSPASDDDFYKFSALGGNLEDIDTDLELSLLSYYSQPVINVRPVQAANLLPANDPRTADLKLGAAVLQEIQVLRFLGNTAAVGRHEGILKFITDRGNVSRAEVESFYRANIGAYIAAEVDVQIPKSYYGAPRPNVVTEIKQIITNFYLNPTQAYFDVLAQKLRVYGLSDGDYGRAADRVLTYSLLALNVDFEQKVLTASELR